MDETLPPKIKRFGSNRILNIFFIVAFSFILLYYTLSAPIWNQSIANKQGIIIHIASGETLTAIANELEAKKIVRQATALKFFVTLLGSRRKVPRGDYLFTENAHVWRVAWRLARGEHDIDPIRIILKEGATKEEMATVFSSSSLQAFRRDLFLSNPDSKEGYLFPDTYFFFPLTTSDEIIDQLSKNFNKRIDPLRPDISNSVHNLDEILTMASIVQKEAYDDKDSSIVAGILWKRIDKGMPLQVDASRNTYTSIGLPKKPIGNPGLVAIRAALYPEDSPYLYYLHDKSGAIHLAKTFSEHKANIAKYLK